mmetsp:Transcript_3712/g.6144  ORF Transcript_3712/g.6144 Transcript_3712/m.6144 type:complete len:96 (+) Transcript_3712:2-289(+)
MAQGVLPITSRLTPSVLGNLTVGYDFGPLEPLKKAVAVQHDQLLHWLREQWTPAVIAAYYQTSDEELKRRRHFMKSAIRNKYTWSNTAKKLQNLF